MSLEKLIAKDLITAMKAKDDAALRSIRAIKSQIMLFNTSGSGKKLDQDAEIKILQKMVKQRRDSLDIFEQQNRIDLAVKEREEIEIISTYLPQQLPSEELKSIITATISDLNAAGMKDMGRVMGAVNQKVAGRAEGKVVAEMVKEMLMS